MYYGVIKPDDIANGPGVRVSLFVSGCENYCKGCFNSEAWDFTYGEPYTEEVNSYLFDSLSYDYIEGLTILGGEPMHPRNQYQVLQITNEFKSRYPEKSLWIYSGYI